MQNKIKYQFIHILLIFIANYSVCYGQQPRVYTVAVVPQDPKLIIHRNWMPLLKYLTAKTGIPLQLKHYQNITQFGADLYKGSADFAYMNPYHEIVARKSQGYIPLLKDGDRKLRGVLVVRKDSPIKSISDLEGKHVAFPSPNAFAASLYTRALFAERGIKIVPEYVTTHANVYRHVILKKVSAGSGIYRTLQKESSSVQDQLRVIFETPTSAPHPICVHPRVPLEIQQAIRAAIIALASDTKNRHLLEAVQITKPVAADYDRDYLPLEKLHLEKFASDSEH